jgi:hypothetical protein
VILLLWRKLVAFTHYHLHNMLLHPVWQNAFISRTGSALCVSSYGS